MSAFLFNQNVGKRPAERRMAQKFAIKRSGHSDGIPQIPTEENIAVVQYSERSGRSARVLFRGVSWRAKYDRRADRTLACEPGTSVRVICQQGNTLIVEIVAL